MGFDNLGIWNGANTKVGAVSLQAVAATPVAAPANTPAMAPMIPAIDPVLAAKMAQLQADF